MLGAGDESELFCSRLGAYIIYLQNTPYGYGFCKYIIYAPSLMRIVRRQAERLQKHPSSGNACSSLACLAERE